LAFWRLIVASSSWRAVSACWAVRGAKSIHLAEAPAGR
jgi:hypothetical protein